MKLHSKALSAAIVAGVAVAFAGCTTGSDAPNPAAQSQAVPSAGVPSSGVPVKDAPTVTDVKTQPGTSKGYVGALKDVTVTKCEASKSPAAFSGTVKNPESSPQSYRIYVSLLVGNKTIGVSEVDVDKVAPGAQKDWSGKLDTGGDGARCVLRVERSAA